MTQQNTPPADDGGKREKEKQRRERTMLVIRIAVLILHIVRCMRGSY
ncbi:hypothetical protein AB0N46_23285 [Streptomyces albidoflavus]